MTTSKGYSIGSGERRGWRFDRSISFGNVLTIISMLLAGFMLWNTQDKRITVLEGNVANIQAARTTALQVQRDRDASQDQINRERFLEIARAEFAFLAAFVRARNFAALECAGH